MKKQELIHLHGLLAEIGNHYEKRADMSLRLGDYESMRVRPTSIHRSKTDHKAAVFALIGGITAELEPTETEAIAAKAD